MTPSPPLPDPRLMAAIVASALFMQNLDSTVVATALPAMARSLGEDPLVMGVAITSYLVALTVFIPLSGWVADRFGAKQVFMVAIATFTLASAFCGLSNGLAEMVAARVLQGLGGAMMVPVGRILLLRRVRKEELLSVTTWLTMPGLLGPLLGPPVGGLLTDLISWRAVFWINVPVGLLGLLLVWRIIPALPKALPPPPDIRGLSMVGAALACLMFAFETLGRGLVPSPVPQLVLLLGVVLTALAVRHCLRVANPALDFRLLSIPSFQVPAVAGTIFRVGAGAVPFLIPLTLQLGFGASAAQSGMVSFATALGAFAMKPMAQFALRRFGFRNVLIWNALLGALAIAACGAFRPGWPMAAIFVVLMVGGLFRSLHFTTLNTLAYADVPHEKLSAATSLYSTAQQLPLALGVAVASAVLQASVAIAGREAAAMPDFTAAFLVGALLTAAAAPLSLRLPPDAGEGIVKR
ncbi:MFS transporter [Teichococcus cervicalis]|uniref:Transporter, major facilitator family protein n=1 Tax=Pseudoroseomonas cervicalis ATCC 49957 TaxID=525371 RepID=D5RS62_9PROT|nr:MFS transporter [Pseudoroseomonas cervicalis]EFH09859.1 transporter, major facilitator family protein [Pseudoroseomonas cervicalis ATCC 49957]